MLCGRRGPGVAFFGEPEHPSVCFFTTAVACKKKSFYLPVKIVYNKRIVALR